jgi:hypothetical protein
MSVDRNAAELKLNVGASTTLLPGFLNVDIRSLGRNVRRGHASNLKFARDRSVSVLFAHAVFEHVFVAQRLQALREWKRVMAPDGVMICLGIPDFETIARLYLDGASGIIGDRFDLFNVYRYTHGDPDGRAIFRRWKRWDPARRPNSAPSGYLPQLHKGLFDYNHLAGLLERVNVRGEIFRYAYPREAHTLSLGFVAKGNGLHIDIFDGLCVVPEIDRFVNVDSIKPVSNAPAPDQMNDKVIALDAPRGLTQRARSTAQNALREFRRDKDREFDG